MSTTSVQASRNPSGPLALVSGVLSRPKVRVSLFVWVLLVLVGAYSPSPMPASPESLARFRTAMDQAEHFRRSEWEDRLVRLEFARENAGNVDVWFWWARGVDKDDVDKVRAEVTRAEEEFGVVDARLSAMVDVARSHVGVWSEEGLAEARSLFSDASARSARAAKRMTSYDLIWLLFTTRCETMGDFVGLVLSVLIRLLLNFFVSSVVAFFSFLWSVGRLAAGYGEGWASWLLFVLVASACAFGMLALYFAALTTVVVAVPVGGVYLLGKARENERLRHPRNAGYDPRFLQQGAARPRPHFD